NPLFQDLNMLQEFLPFRKHIFSALMQLIEVFRDFLSNFSQFILRKMRLNKRVGIGFHHKIPQLFYRLSKSVGNDMDEKQENQKKEENKIQRSIARSQHLLQLKGIRQCSSDIYRSIIFSII